MGPDGWLCALGHRLKWLRGPGADGPDVLWAK